MNWTNSRDQSRTSVPDCHRAYRARESVLFVAGCETYYKNAVAYYLSLDSQLFAYNEVHC